MSTSADELTAGIAGIADTAGIADIADTAGIVYSIIDAFFKTLPL